MTEPTKIGRGKWPRKHNELALVSRARNGDDGRSVETRVSLPPSCGLKKGDRVVVGINESDNHFTFRKLSKMEDGGHLVMVQSKTTRVTVRLGRGNGEHNYDILGDLGYTTYRIEGDLIIVKPIRPDGSDA